MNYEYHYKKLVDRARNRKLNGYKESHHIVPKCLGGSDNIENLVELTGREHFIAHLLLAKIYEQTPGLVYAAMMMCVAGNGQVGRSKNRQYEWLKKKYSRTASRMQSGSNNSQYGSFWITDGISNKKVKSDVDIPAGWSKGRFYPKRLKVKAKSKQETINDQTKSHVMAIHNHFISTGMSLRQYCRTHYDKSVPNLSKLFKKYVS